MIQIARLMIISTRVRSQSIGFLCHISIASTAQKKMFQKEAKTNTIQAMIVSIILSVAYMLDISKSLANVNWLSALF
jgi:hypothetical protein